MKVVSLIRLTYWYFDGGYSDVHIFLKTINTESMDIPCGFLHKILIVLIINAILNSVCDGSSIEEDLLLQLETIKEENKSLKAQVDELSKQLGVEKDRIKQMWLISSQQLADQGRDLAAKEETIAKLSAKLQELSVRSPGHHSRSDLNLSFHPEPETIVRRKGEAPPVEPFTGEDTIIHLDDWMTFTESSNVESVKEILLQLAGHLRGRAL